MNNDTILVSFFMDGANLRLSRIEAEALKAKLEKALAKPLTRTWKVDMKSFPREKLMYGEKIYLRLESSMAGRRNEWGGSTSNLAHELCDFLNANGFVPKAAR